MAISHLNQMEASIIDSTIPRTRTVDMSLSMQRWKAKVEEFNSLAPPNRQISDAQQSQQLVNLRRFIRNVPELKDIDRLVDVMCSCHTKTPNEISQIYFDVATSWDGVTNMENQGRRGTPSRNIHTAEILGEDNDEDVPLENNVHEVLPTSETWLCLISNVFVKF